MNKESESPLRPFDDLIKEIEFEGEKFIPSAKIAALCFNYNEKAVKYKAKFWINNSYDYMLWYNFETKILAPKKMSCYIGIDRSFNISMDFIIDGKKPMTNTGTPVYNQIKIVKLLIKWGFIAKD
ncbi:MAG: hypothetical protein WC026_13155 [Hyphomicrobium sp.]|uniref:hypothetical protein n=1 Tax=Hyphomicrobium sp. TaxID=82 RepID=UPI003566A3A2